MAPLLLAMALVDLGGCVTPRDRGLAASWYVVDEPPPMPVAGQEPDLSDIVAKVDDIYVAIVNRGPKEAKLYGLFMNGEAAMLPGFIELPRPNGFYAMTPGQVLVLPTGIFKSGPPCRLPVSLAVRTSDKKRRRPRPIKLIGTMPGALPSEWLETCGR